MLVISLCQCFPLEPHILVIKAAGFITEGICSTFCRLLILEPREPSLLILPNLDHSFLYLGGFKSAVLGLGVDDVNKRLHVVGVVVVIDMQLRQCGENGLRTYDALCVAHAYSQEEASDAEEAICDAVAESGEQRVGPELVLTHVLKLLSDPSQIDAILDPDVHLLDLFLLVQSKYIGHLPREFFMSSLLILRRRKRVPSGMPTCFTPSAIVSYAILTATAAPPVFESLLLCWTEQFTWAWARRNSCPFARNCFRAPCFQQARSPRHPWLLHRGTPRLPPLTKVVRWRWWNFLRLFF
mmetsp:Transcript_45148/g.81546  ORF Transcript_45148/g.81546 Transcript_45148/m.81546 type:complete len:297 (-) Transcript_45148:2324-3214(-)